MAGDAYRQSGKRSLYLGIGIAVLLAALISWAFVASNNQTAHNQAAAVAARSDSEKAYENIVKDSLNTYHSRYSNYPADYKSLLGDIAKTPDLYGVNEEGMNELKGLDNYLAGFAYSKMNDNDYMFTYQEANSGETVTVTNE